MLDVRVGCFGGYGKVGDEQEVGIEVVVVKCTDCVSRALVFTYKDDIGSAGVDQKLARVSQRSTAQGLYSTNLGRIFDACVHFGEPDLVWVEDFPNSNLPPVSSLELFIRGIV